MANGYYNHGTWPASNSAGASAPARAELDAVTSGFGLLPNPLGTGQQGFNGGQWTNPLIIGQSGGGSIDAIPIGATTPSTGAFTTLGANGAVSFSGGGSLSGTYSGNPSFSGQPAYANIDINGGAIDATPIGATTRSTGLFTTLGANGAVTFSSGGTLTGTFSGGTHTSTAITSSTIDSSPVGATTRSSGLFTTLGANGAVNFSAGGALAGTYSGTPTFSGNVNFSGTPTYSNAPTVGGSPVLVAANNLSDVANAATARANLGVTLPLIGSCTNLYGVAPGGTKTITLTLDEVILGTGVGTPTTKRSGLTLNFNGAGVGANGMDTGSMPVSGNVAFYAIFNPTTTTDAVLGVACSTTASTPKEYGGSNMPSGFVSSGRIATLMTDGAGNLRKQAVINDDVWVTSGIQIINQNGAVGNTQVSLAGLVPFDADYWEGWAGAGNSVAASDGGLLDLGADSSTGIGHTQVLGFEVISGAAISNYQSFKMPNLKSAGTAPQAFFSLTVQVGGTPLAAGFLRGYRIKS